MCAIRNVKDDERRMELVSYLIEKGADVNKAVVRHFLLSTLPALRVPRWVGWLAVVLVPVACL